MPDEADDLYERAQSHISFGPVTEKNVEQVKKLNLAVFPVRYNDKFYADLWKPPIQEYTQLGYFSDILVGAICARVEPAEGSTFKVYIMTIGVLAPYRRLGIGKQLLEELMKTCTSQENCVEVYLHVQVNNQEAIDFYQKFGFSVGEVMKDYYKKIEPPDAVVLSKKLK